jgi:DNA-binding HxlR family transcriptional regulator
MAVTKADNQYLDIEERVNKIFSAERGSLQFCPVKDVLGHFADKWSIFTILALGKREKLRFNELKEAVEGISQRMLTVTLRSLEENGLVERKMYTEIPPRVEYWLTPLGRSLLEKILELATWSSTNMDAIVKARERFKKKSG